MYKHITFNLRHNQGTLLLSTSYSAEQVIVACVGCGWLTCSGQGGCLQSEVRFKLKVTQKVSSELVPVIRNFLQCPPSTDQCILQLLLIWTSLASSRSVGRDKQVPFCELELDLAVQD